MSKFVPIIDYEGLYEIDRNGEIRTVPRKFLDTLGRMQNRPQIFRRSKVTGHGYSSITLIKNKKSRSFAVHRLVYESFIGPCGDLHINHIDGNKLNNKLSNLELVTPEENMQHALKLGLLKPRKGHTFKKTILTTTQRKAIVRSKLTNKELAEKYNVNVKTIYNIKRRATHPVASRTTTPSRKRG